MKLTNCIRLFILLNLCFLPVSLHAAGSNGFSGQVIDRLGQGNISITDIESLRSGAIFFAKNCTSCHAVELMRYKRIADDLKMSEEEMKSAGIMPDDANIYDSIKTPLSPADAKAAYGTVPPDLSLTARVRGTSWILAYLRSFYQDDARPSGANNLVFPNTAMSNVFIGIQGIQSPVIETDSHGEKRFLGFKQESEGSLNKKAFYNQMRDLTNYMDYLAEPAKIQRVTMGWKVLLFIFLLIIVTYFIKREYWKDVK